MAMPHDVPTVPEIVEAVRGWLDDVGTAAQPPSAFHIRIAVNLLEMVDRELELGPGHEVAHRARLAQLGVADDAELCAMIRSGRADDRLDEVRTLVWASVRDKLAVANPSYVERRTS